MGVMGSGLLQQGRSQKTVFLRRLCGACAPYRRRLTRPNKSNRHARAFGRAHGFSGCPVSQTHAPISAVVFICLFIFITKPKTLAFFVK
jgi:hypothetical protein